MEVNCFKIDYQKSYLSEQQTEIELTIDPGLEKIIRMFFSETELLKANRTVLEDNQVQLKLTTTPGQVKALINAIACAVLYYSRN